MLGRHLKVLKTGSLGNVEKACRKLVINEKCEKIAKLSEIEKMSEMSKSAKTWQMSRNM